MAPRTKEQFDEMRTKSRKAIMDSAMELFCRRGYYGTSVSMIANKTGVSTGLMYNYFRSKDELLEAIVVEGMEIIEQAFQDMKKMDDPNSVLKGIVTDLFDMMADDDPHFWKLYFNLLMLPDLPDGIRKTFTTYLVDMFQQLEDVFREMGVEDPVAEARIFAAMGDGVILHYWMIGKPYPFKEVRDLIIKKYTR